MSLDLRHSLSIHIQETIYDQLVYLASHQVACRHVYEQIFLQIFIINSNIVESVQGEEHNFHEILHIFSYLIHHLAVVSFLPNERVFQLQLIVMHKVSTEFLPDNVHWMVILMDMVLYDENTLIKIITKHKRFLPSLTTHQVPVRLLDIGPLPLFGHCERPALVHFGFLFFLPRVEIG